MRVQGTRYARANPRDACKTHRERENRQRDKPGGQCLLNTPPQWQPGKESERGRSAKQTKTRVLDRGAQTEDARRGRCGSEGMKHTTPIEGVEGKKMLRDDWRARASQGKA